MAAGVRERADNEQRTRRTSLLPIQLDPPAATAAATSAAAAAAIPTAAVVAVALAGGGPIGGRSRFAASGLAVAVVLVIRRSAPGGKAGADK